MGNTTGTTFAPTAPPTTNGIFVCSHDPNLPGYSTGNATNPGQFIKRTEKTIKITPSDLANNPANYYLGDYQGVCNTGGNLQTNTNMCLSLVPGLNACAGSSITNLPSTECCAVINKMNWQGCWCNESTRYLMGSDGINGMLGSPSTLGIGAVSICTTGHLGWDWSGGNSNASCSSYVAYNAGSQEPDQDLERDRLITAINFSIPFDSAGDPTKCFSYADVSSQLGAYVDTSNFTTSVPYGVGQYNGFQDSAEYLGIYWAGLNYNLWNGGHFDRTSGQIGIDPTGSKLDLKAFANGSFFDGQVPYSNFSLGQTYSFNGLGTKINKLQVNGDTNMGTLIKFFHDAANTKAYGKEAICNFHEKYCKPVNTTATDGHFNPLVKDEVFTSMEPSYYVNQQKTKATSHPTWTKNQQYEDYNACMAFLNTIPDVSQDPNCKNYDRVLAGDSVTCRFKHHFMSPIDPSMHCFHMGPTGTMDAMGHQKCNNSTECTGQGTNADGSNWLPIGDISIANQPANVQTAMANTDAQLAAGTRPGYPNLC